MKPIPAPRRSVFLPARSRLQAAPAAINRFQVPKRKFLVVLLHVLVWALYFSLPYLMRPGSRPPEHHHEPPQFRAWFWFSFDALQNLVLIPTFYLSAFYLLPKLLPGRRFLLLALVSLGLFGLHLGLGGLVTNLMFGDDEGPPRFLMSLMNFLVVLSIACVVYAFRHAQQLDRSRQQNELERMQAELQFLRWQISPHFLFNVLNNMVALARKKSDKLEPALIQMSHLMRYMLYETDEARVTLLREIEYLQSFIRLQSMRYHDVRLELKIDIPEPAPQRIEPMLLIPFVENAFKHGIDLIADPVIELELSLHGSRLLFALANRVNPAPVANKDDASGVGLVNVRKRLNFLYGTRHQLQTLEAEGWYRVRLTIELE